MAFPMPNLSSTPRIWVGQPKFYLNQVLNSLV